MKDVRYILGESNNLGLTFVVRLDSTEQLVDFTSSHLLYRSDVIGTCTPGEYGINWFKNRYSYTNETAYECTDGFFQPKIIIPTNLHEGTDTLEPHIWKSPPEHWQQHRCWVLQRDQLLPHRYLEQVTAFIDMMHKRY